MKKIFKSWLNIWLYVITLISGIIIGVTVVKWNSWTFQTKIFAFATILLPIHVLEEWHFPGGFALSGIEKICKDKNTPYGYTWGNGYFEKYLK